MRSPVEMICRFCGTGISVGISLRDALLGKDLEHLDDFIRGLRPGSVDGLFPIRDTFLGTAPVLFDVFFHGLRPWDVDHLLSLRDALVGNELDQLDDLIHGLQHGDVDSLSLRGALLEHDLLHIALGGVDFTTVSVAPHDG